LGGVVSVNLDTGNLTITLIDAVNSYFALNPFRTGGQLTACSTRPSSTYNPRIRPKRRNSPDGSAGFVINAVGVFPIKLANTGTAIARLSLRLMMPVNDSTLLDTTAPILTV